MKSLLPIWNYAKLLYLRRALREIHPLHEDVPYIVHQLNELEKEFA